MTTTIEALPPPGQRSAPATYVALMDAWHSAIAAYSEQASAAATEINGANAASAALVAAATAMVNAAAIAAGAVAWVSGTTYRSDEHTSELQSLMRNSYAGFCLNKKKKTKDTE